ncbi:hypothetical protein [Rhodococcus baikonurensis]|uniref:Uncharacterized protein n=1 Tax=Rhodococcus baikonurensis TaxID=172041 RepID=A0ABV5XK73_9NOCA
MATATAVPAVAITDLSGEKAVSCHPRTTINTSSDPIKNAMLAAVFARFLQC